MIFLINVFEKILKGGNVQVLPTSSSRINSPIQRNYYNGCRAMQCPSFGTKLGSTSRKKVFGWLVFTSQDFMSKHGDSLKAKLRQLERDGHSGDVINFRQEVNQRSNSSTRVKRLKNGKISIKIPCVQKRYIPVLTVKQGDKEFKIDLPFAVRGKKAVDIANSKSFAKFLDALIPEKIEKYRQAAMRKSKKRK